ncbi:MAG: F0F1 ATP synthase subunit beta, partial [bacterium]
MSHDNTAVKGKVVQVLGPVVDVEFPENQLPPILTALQVTNPFISDKPWNLTLEISQHLGNNLARTIAMDSTDGLVRGMDVHNCGEGIT